MNSDEVNSIGDTTESRQVAECIKTSYYNMCGRYDLPEHNQFLQLAPSDDPVKPTLMTIPDGVQRVEWIKYFDSNPADSAGSLSSTQFGAFSHGLNLDLVPQPGWSTSSTSLNTIGTGSKTFIVGVAISGINPGQSVQATAAGTPGNAMFGTVTSYSGSTLVINVTSTTGSGTFSNWSISGGIGANAAPGYIDVKMIDVERFVNMVANLNPLDPTVGQYTFTIPTASTGAPMNFTIFYKNNHTPTYCTILSNKYVLFDSFDNTQDSTLQANKSLTYAWVIPSWQMVDAFIPNLDDQQFPMLLAESKALATQEIKGRENKKQEQEVLRQLTSLQKFKAVAHRPTPFEQLPSFGRQKGTGGYAFTKYPQ